MKPVVNGLEQKWAGQVVFFRVNTDDREGQDLVARFHVESIPYFVFVGRDGLPGGQLLGGQTAGELEKHLKQIAASPAVEKRQPVAPGGSR